jgi:hypothetical protein
LFFERESYKHRLKILEEDLQEQEKTYETRINTLREQLEGEKRHCVLVAEGLGIKVEVCEKTFN